MDKVVVKQTVMIHDSVGDLFDFSVAIASRISNPIYSSIGTTNLELTRTGAENLIKNLELALELDGKDFLLYTSGRLSVDGKDYASVEDYRNGVEETE